MGNDQSQKAPVPVVMRSASILSRPKSHDIDQSEPEQESKSPSTPLSPEYPSTSKSAYASARSRSRVRHRRRSSLLLVRNGVTNVYISARICKISSLFWTQNVKVLPQEKQLEVACSIFFTMMASNKEMKRVMKANRNAKQAMEETSLKYLNMFGWILRNLLVDGIDLYASLSKLGAVHQAMGVKIEHFDPMLQAMHETFSYYFGQRYTIEVKYAFDEIFAVAAQIMTGQELKCSAHLLALAEQFQGDEIPFLKSLGVCLSSEIGKEYLYRYLAQTWCDEMVIFLQTLSRFKAMPSDKERFMIARDIVKTCIEPSATFALNISYEVRSTYLKCEISESGFYDLRDLYTQALNAMKALEKKFAAKEDFDVPLTLFVDVEYEINKLLLDNHWAQFVEGIQELQFKSFDVDE